MLFQNLDFLYIQCGIGCVSNCFGCKRKEAISKNLDEEKIIKIIDFLIKKKVFSNNIFLYNRDIATYSTDFFNSIKERKKYFSHIYYHTSFELLEQNKEVYYGNQCIYQRDIISQEEFNKLKILLENDFSTFPQTIFVLWYDSREVFHKITVLFKERFGNIKLKKDIQGSYSFFQGNTEFKVFPKKRLRQELQHCFFENSIYVDDNIEIDRRFFPSSGFELRINGDIFLHELPCGFGDIKLSNIFRGEEKIKNDFRKFSSYIENLRNVGESQSSMCARCNGLKYSYE